MTAPDCSEDACERGTKDGPIDGLTATKPGLDAGGSPNLKPVDAADAVTLGLAQLKMGAWAGAPELTGVALVGPRENAEASVVAPEEPCPAYLNLNSGCVIGAVKGDGEPVSLEVTMASERVGSGFVTTFVTAADDISGGAMVSGLIVSSLGSTVGSAAEPFWSGPLLLPCTDTSITFVRGNRGGSVGMDRADGAPDEPPLDAAASGRVRGVDVRNDSEPPSDSPNGLGVKMPSLVSDGMLDLGGVDVKIDPCC